MLIDSDPPRFGLRVAFFFTRTYTRVLRTGLAVTLDPSTPPSVPLRRHFDRLDKASPSSSRTPNSPRET